MIFKMKRYLVIILLILSCCCIGQNEYKKWYFGIKAALDFMTTPPSPITHSTLVSYEGSASVADGAGNLLMYTDGVTVWNKQHLVMANGTVLMGNASTVQTALIVKQPGNNNIYFIFTLDLQGGSNGLRYSVVDMALAAGLGSVTTKNTLLATPCTEQLTGVRHCNGIDTWVVAHDLGSNNFKSFLVTSSGVTSMPVNSSVGPTPPFYSSTQITGQGTIKISPSGSKLGLTFYHGGSNNETAIFDFNRSTGTVSNYLSLLTGTTECYGCEFSPDETKFYATQFSTPLVFQWNLCAGSSLAIIASKVTVGTANGPAVMGQMQLAIDGKIYVAFSGSSNLSLITSPNSAGTSCNFVNQSVPLGTGYSGIGLPNFAGGNMKTLPPLSVTVSAASCATATFSAPSPSAIAIGCTAATTIQSILWNFMQPGSVNNTSTLLSTVHNFGLPGTYPVKLAITYPCGSDTIYQNVIIPGPSISVTTTSVNCSTPGSASINISGGTGPFAYTWNPSGQTTGIATVTPGAYSITVNDAGTGCIFTISTQINPPLPLTGTITATPSVACAQQTGTASISLTPGSGGMGNYSYSWSTSQTTPSLTGLGGGNYAVTVTDGLCSLTKTFTIVQPPAINVTITPVSPSVCAGTTVSLQALASGGTGTVSYTWHSSQAGSTYTTTQAVAGSTVHTLTVNDSAGCQMTFSVIVNYLPVPTITVNSATICVKETASLIASGASNYTWTPGFIVGPSLSVTVTATKQYTVTGSIGTCLASIITTVTVLKCTGEAEIQTSDFYVYPNPVKDQINIETQTNAKYELFSLYGQLLTSGELHIGTNSIMVGGLHTGNYILRITSAASLPTSRIIAVD
jgi:hypothetical protein